MLALILLEVVRKSARPRRTCRWHGLVLSRQEEVDKAQNDMMLALILVEVMRKSARPRRMRRWHGLVFAGREEDDRAKKDEVLALILLEVVRSRPGQKGCEGGLDLAGRRLTRL